MELTNELAARGTAASTPGDSAMAADLLDMIGASWMSQAICVAAELHIPDLLANGSLTIDELAIRTQCSPGSLGRLLRALASLGICIEQADKCFALSPMGALLRSDARSSVRSWAIWWGRHLWPVWHNLQSSIRTGKSARELATGGTGYAHVEKNAEMAMVFNQAMVELTRIVADAALRVYDFSAATRLVDVGGGYGELLQTILAAHPAQRGVLFDLPHAIDGAKARMAGTAVALRCDFVAGNFFDTAPAGGDLYLLKSILHNWTDERATVILGNCRSAMPQHARLVLIERIMPERMNKSVREQALARTDLNMLVGLGGRERTEAEIARLLATSGFKAVRFLPLTSEYTLVEGLCA